MRSYKITESIPIIKKVFTNRVNSVPSFKTKSQHMISNKFQRPKSKNLILIKKHILNNKKGLYNKNINRSAGNLLKEGKLKSILENDPKYQIKKTKKINPLMSIEKSSSLILPEMNSNIMNSMQTIKRSNSSLDFYLKTMSESKKGTNVMNDQELILLLQAKCKDIGINFRENMFFKFKEFCNTKCKNRIADFVECNFGLNSIKVISLLLLDTNRLSRLDLSKNNIGNQGVEILVNSIKKSMSLVSLNLSSNSITHKGGQLLFNSFIYQQSIVDLNLSTLEGSNRNRITSVGIENIPIFLNVNHFIEMLHLSGNSIKNEGFLYICEGLEKNQSLQYLDISNNGINEKGIKKGLDVISTYKIYSKINNLNISNNQILNNGILLLAGNLRYFPNLTSLNISYCGLEFKGFQSLLKTVQHMKRLENLNVSGNILKYDNFYLLKEYFALFGIRYLNMSRCSLGDKSAYYLGECVSSNESLKYLNISGNSISDAGFKGFMNIFKFNKSIESFDCSCNFITNNTCREFVRSLFYNICLKSINLYDNQLNDEIGGDFINVIENNGNLIHINLAYNRIQSKTIDDINKKLKINYEKRKSNIIPEIERNIRDLEFRPEQFESLSRIIIEKQNLLKLSYKKLKEDDKNFNNLMHKENKKLEGEKNKLEKLVEQRKSLENEIFNINKRKENNELETKREEEKTKNKIEFEKRIIFDIQKENEDLLVLYNKKKKEIDEKIQKVEKKLKISLNKYNLVKKQYDQKDKEYIDKFKYYQNLLDPNFLRKKQEIKIEEENDNNLKVNDLRSSKIKFRLSSKKLNMKNNTQGNINNNVYSTTTLSTGNNGNINAEEKRTFKFNKKK